MNVKLFLSIFFLATISLGSSCHKDKEPVTYIPLDTTFLSYCAFPEGSWWVYEEINTKQKDSLFVSSYQTEPFEDKKSSMNYYRLWYNIVSRTDTFYYFARPWGDISKYAYVLTENYDVSFSADRFLYPFNNADTINNVLYLKDLIDSVTINGVLYKDIQVLENKELLYQYKIKTEYYCKNVGVIRREYFDGKIWELTKYHINN